MNRAFILVLIPAGLVGVTHSALRYGAQVAVPLALVLSAVVAAAYWWMRRRRSA